MKKFSTAKVIEFFDSDKDMKFKYLATSAAYELFDNVFLFGCACIHIDKQNSKTVYYDTPELFVLVSKHRYQNITELKGVSIYQDNNILNLQHGKLHWQFSIHGKFDHITQCILEEKHIPQHAKEKIDNMEYFFFRNVCIQANTFNNGLLGIINSIQIECNTKKGLLRESSEFNIPTKEFFSEIISDWKDGIVKDIFSDTPNITLLPIGYIMPQNISNESKRFLNAVWDGIKENGPCGAVKIEDCVSADIQEMVKQGGELQVLENYTSHTISYFNTGDLLAKALFVGKKVKCEIDIVAPYKGFYSYINKTIGVDEVLFYYYNNTKESEIQCSIKSDLYTSQLLLTWKNLHEIQPRTMLSFNIKNDVPVLEIYNDSLQKGDEVILLFGKQVKIDYFNVSGIRTEYSYRVEETFPLSFFVNEKVIKCNTEKRKATLYLQKDDLSYFINYAFLSAKIIHTNGDSLELHNWSLIKGLEENIYLFRLRASLFAHILDVNNIQYHGKIASLEPEENSNNREEVHVKEESCYVYLMVDSINGYHKIGISNKPEYRERTLQSEKPTIELLCAKQYPTRMLAEAIESALHKVYAEKRIRGEWFVLNNQDIEYLKTMLND